MEVEKKSATREVLDMIRIQPGITHADLKAALPHIKPSTISMSLHDLKKRNLIRRENAEGENRFHLAVDAGDSQAQSSAAPAEPKADATQQRFRVARTSDRTFILFGLTEQPLELSEEQTRILIDFVADEG